MKTYNRAIPMSYKVICVNDFINGSEVLFTKGKSYISEDTPIIYDPNTLQPVYCCLIRDNYNRMYKFYKSKESDTELFKVMYFSDHFVELEEYRELQIESVLDGK